MAAHEEFRDALEAGDLARVRAMWREIAPHLPQEATEADMHHARTQASTVSFRARAYSHAWLAERGLPSGLPDELKPKAERLYPRSVTAVGIGIHARSTLLKPAAAAIQKAMEAVVEDAYANGDTDPALVKARMEEARLDETRRLFGRWGV